MNLLLFWRNNENALGGIISRQFPLFIFPDGKKQADGVQLWGGNIHNAKFRNVHIRKAGKDYKFQKKMQKPYGIAVHDDGSAVFGGTTIKGTKKYDKKQSPFSLEVTK